MSNYSALLRDPRWQKKRLNILNRDDFTCRNCGSKDKTLHVHHCYYEGLKPWEYPEASLNTLCEDCHELETAALPKAKKVLTDSIGRMGFDSQSYCQLAAAFDQQDARDCLIMVMGAFTQGKDMDALATTIFQATRRE